eukprot:5335292-Prymnesium_polylepis.2
MPSCTRVEHDVDTRSRVLSMYRRAVRQLEVEPSTALDARGARALTLGNDLLAYHMRLLFYRESFVYR